DPARPGRHGGPIGDTVKRAPARRFTVRGVRRTPARSGVWYALPVRMSTLDQAQRARDAARTRRAHLSLRALLALVVRAATDFDQRARALREHLDPSGGAHDPRVPTRGSGPA